MKRNRPTVVLVMAETSRFMKEETVLRYGVPLGAYTVFYHPPGNGEQVGLEIELPERITIEAKENKIALKVPDSPKLENDKDGKDATKK